METTCRGATNYQRVAQVGRGGFGTIYTVRRGGQELIEKEMVLARSSHEAMYHARMQSSRGVPRLHDVIIHTDDRVSLIMERATSDFSAFERISEDDAVPVLRSVLQTIAQAHAQKILHLDIKGGNVMRSENGGILLIDWGLAHPSDQEPEHKMGTPAYMSPEQLSGVISEKTDVWAFGVFAYQLLTGRLPYNGLSATEIWRQILTRPVEIPPQLSPNAQGFLRVALERDPMQRSTAVELLAHPFLSATEHPELERQERWNYLGHIHRGILDAVADLTWSTHETGVRLASSPDSTQHGAIPVHRAIETVFREYSIRDRMDTAELAAMLPRDLPGFMHEAEVDRIRHTWGESLDLATFTKRILGRLPREMFRPKTPYLGLVG
jgi:serine/threonine protein kinase